MEKNNQKWVKGSGTDVKYFARSTLREKSPNLSVLSPNAGKYGPEKTPYLDNFHAEVSSREV